MRHTHVNLEQCGLPDREAEGKAGSSSSSNSGGGCRLEPATQAQDGAGEVSACTHTGANEAQEQVRTQEGDAGHTMGQAREGRDGKGAPEAHATAHMGQTLAPQATAEHAVHDSGDRMHSPEETAN